MDILILNTYPARSSLFCDNGTGNTLVTISGRGWSQGVGAIFEDGDLGRDPEHDIWSQDEDWGWGCSCVMGYLEETRNDENR